VLACAPGLHAEMVADLARCSPLSGSSYGAAEQRVIELEQANDDLEHRLLSLEGSRVSPPPFDYLPPI